MTAAPSLYALLPALYRQRDDESADQPLRALGAVLDEARAAITADIAALYRDWFVDTAADDALPLIADLVGAAIPPGAADPRRLVAQAIAVGRAKGTRRAAEQRLSALTGWPIRISMRPDAYRVRIEAFRQGVAPVTHGTPSAVDPSGHDDAARRYRFHPMARDVPLYAPGGTDLLPRPLHDLDGRPRTDAFAIHLRDRDGGRRTLTADDVAIVDLTDWEPRDRDDGGPPADRALVDVRLGRFVLPAEESAEIVTVSCWRACAHEMDGQDTAREVAPWLAYCVRDADPAARMPADPSVPPVFSGLDAALAAFRGVKTAGEIRIADSAVHAIGEAFIDDATTVCPNDPQQPRRLTIAALAGETPCLRGDLAIVAGRTGLDVTLAGLSIDGRVAVEGPVALRLDRCSVQADGVAVYASARGGAARLLLDHASVGPLALERGCGIEAHDSVIDGGGLRAIMGEGRAVLTRSTVIGQAALASIEATDTLFTAQIEAGDMDGLLTACVVPAGSRGPMLSDCVTGDAARAWRFADARWGMPGYARLDHASHAIRTGATDGGEIGVGNAARFAERDALLRDHAASVLPIGLDWEIVYR